MSFQHIRTPFQICQNPGMAKTTARGPQRRDALSPERIIETAIDILDRDGEAALTFKALTGELHTGAGAIYHHIANKTELLAAATDQVVARLLADIPRPTEPADALRALALGLFDAIDAHPWVGVQLSNNPLPAVIRIWTAVGEHLQTLGIPSARLAEAGSTLINYVLGSAAQYAAGARTAADPDERQAYLDDLGRRVPDLDPGTLSDTIAEELHHHDDRAQFLAGVDIILTGITHLPDSPTHGR